MPRLMILEVIFDLSFTFFNEAGSPNQTQNSLINLSVLVCMCGVLYVLFLGLKLQGGHQAHLAFT